MTKHNWTLGPLAAFLVICAGWPAAAADEGQGVIRTHSFVTAVDLVSVPSSSSFEEIPDMTLEFFVRRRGAVIINFCGHLNTDGTQGSLRVLPEIDEGDVQVTPAGELQIAVQAARLPHCFAWVAPEVNRGRHSVSILWLKAVQGSGFIAARSLIVQGDLRIRR